MFLNLHKFHKFATVEDKKLKLVLNMPHITDQYEEQITISIFY